MHGGKWFKKNVDRVVQDVRQRSPRSPRLTQRELAQLNRRSEYLTDAPSDGSEYVRQNSAWVVNSGGAGGVAEAPIDGTQYGRQNGSWTAITSSATTWGSITGTLSAQTDLQTELDLKLEDAPSDGSQYARQNGAWAVVTGGGSVDETANYNWTGSHSWTSTLQCNANINVNRVGQAVDTKVGIYADDGNDCGITLRKGGSALANQRWYIQCEDTAETGSNVGSDLYISRFDDTGTTLDEDSVRIARDTGSVFVNGNGSGNSTAVNVSAPAGQIATFNIRKDGLLRWQMRCGNGAETGSDAGSNFILRAVADSGSAVSSDVLSIERATGEITVGSGAGFVNLYSYFSIWAEENGGLGLTTEAEWAFGNGANTPTGQGVPVGVDCELYAGGWVGNGGTATIAVYRNGVSVATFSNGHTVFGSAVSFSAGDIVNFVTVSSSGTAAPNTATAHFRVPLIAS